MMLANNGLTGIKMWDSLEKDRYYYTLFQTNFSLDDVARNTSDSKAKIKERIKKYSLFLDVYNALKSKHININIEELPSYLPLVDQQCCVLCFKNRNTLERYSAELRQVVHDTFAFFAVGKKRGLGEIIVCFESKSRFGMDNS